MAGNQSKDDQALLFGLIFVLGFIAVGVFWYLFEKDIINILRWIRLAELQLIGLFRDTIMIMPADPTHAPTPASVKQTSLWLWNARGDQLTWPQISLISSTIVMQYLRWPCIIGLGILGIVVLYRGPETRFRKVYTLDRLIETQSISWKYIQPIVKFNPANSEQRAPGSSVPDVLPPFAEALSPEEFLALHRVPVIDGKVDRDALRRAFIHQLGPRWQGPRKLPMHIRALLAAFALKGARKREEADRFLAELSESWDPKKGLRLTSRQKVFIRKTLADPKIGGEAIKIAGEHGYVSTAMIRVLHWCRQRGGVLAPAQFLWLRAVDRQLWYPLNNVGRRSYHVEASGAMAHYLAEIGLHRVLPMPKVDTALNAMDEYVTDNNPVLPPVESRKSQRMKA